MDRYHAQSLKMSVVCFVETYTMTLAGIVPSVQAATPQWELATVEGPEEPDLALALFVPLTT